VGRDKLFHRLESVLSRLRGEHRAIPGPFPSRNSFSRSGVVGLLGADGCSTRSAADTVAVYATAALGRLGFAWRSDSLTFVAMARSCHPVKTHFSVVCNRWRWAGEDSSSTPEAVNPETKGFRWLGFSGTYCKQFLHSWKPRALVGKGRDAAVLWLLWVELRHLPGL